MATPGRQARRTARATALGRTLAHTEHAIHTTAETAAAGARLNGEPGWAESGRVRSAANRTAEATRWQLGMNGRTPTRPGADTRKAARDAGLANRALGR